MPIDLAIRGAAVVTPTGVVQKDLFIDGGKFVDGESAATQTIDGKGLTAFPGLIDSHVHFNEPGRTDWEGIATGSAALAAGGGTCFFDMPLNSSPPTLDGESFDLKLAAAKASAVTDYALWGGLTPTNLDKLDELASRGVIGFKAFMSNSGIEDFSRADDWTLEHGMDAAARLGLIVAVHAENEEMVAGKTAWMRSRLPNLGARDWVYTREPLAEADAIQRALLLASHLKCRVHVVHISNRYCVELVNVLKAQADASCETCPHYFMLTAEDVKQLGAIAKCAPPIRVAPHGNELWVAIHKGQVDTIGSDHSPAPWSMKSDPDFFKAWGGISGVQTTLASLLTREPYLPLERIAALTASNVAKRFRLAGKGQIAAGFDADLALVDVNDRYTLTREMLLDRHKLSPYVGRTFRGLVKRTIVRGQTVFVDGRIVSEPIGQLVKPGAA